MVVASEDGFERILSAHDDDLIEFACHPGYADDELRSSYKDEREAELRTLCDERLPPLLEKLGFTLLGSQLQFPRDVTP